MTKGQVSNTFKPGASFIIGEYDDSSDDEKEDKSTQTEVDDEAFKPLQLLLKPKQPRCLEDCVSIMKSDVSIPCESPGAILMRTSSHIPNLCRDNAEYNEGVGWLYYMCNLFGHCTLTVDGACGFSGPG